MEEGRERGREGEREGGREEREEERKIGCVREKEDQCRRARVYGGEWESGGKERERREGWRKEMIRDPEGEGEERRETRSGRRKKRVTKVE